MQFTNTKFNGVIVDLTLLTEIMERTILYSLDSGIMNELHTIINSKY